MPSAVLRKPWRCKFHENKQHFETGNADFILLVLDSGAVAVHPRYILPAAELLDRVDNLGYHT